MGGRGRRQIISTVQAAQTAQAVARARSDGGDGSSGDCSSGTGWDEVCAEDEAKPGLVLAPSISLEPAESAIASSYASISTNTPEPEPPEPEPHTGDENSGRKSGEKDGWDDDWGNDDW